MSKNLIILIALATIACVLILVFFKITQDNITASNNFPILKQFHIQTESYVNDSYQYSLEYPEGWQVTETNNEHKEVIFKNSDTEQISIKIYPQENLTPLEWIKKKIDEQEKFSLLEDNNKKINDINGMYLRFKETDTQHSMLVYVPYNDFMYELKLTYPANEKYSYYKKIFSKLTSSFAFSN